MRARAEGASPESAIVASCVLSPSSATKTETNGVNRSASDGVWVMGTRCPIAWARASAANLAMKVKVGYGRIGGDAMRAKARILAGAVYLGLAVLSFAGSVVAAEPPPVVVGEVGTRIAGGSSDLPRALRRVLESEIANLALVRVPGARRFVLSASLVR